MHQNFCTCDTYWGLGRHDRQNAQDPTAALATMDRRQNLKHELVAPIFVVSGSVMVVSALLLLPCTGASAYSARNQNLTRVPSDIPTGAESIDLTGNSIPEVEPGTFRFHSSCRYLYLGENRLEELRLGALEGLNNLTILHLQSNEIKVSGTF